MYSGRTPSENGAAALVSCWTLCQLRIPLAVVQAGGADKVVDNPDAEYRHLPLGGSRAGLVVGLCDPADRCLTQSNETVEGDQQAVFQILITFISGKTSEVLETSEVCMLST